MTSKSRVTANTFALPLCLLTGSPAPSTLRITLGYGKMLPNHPSLGVETRTDCESRLILILKQNFKLKGGFPYQVDRLPTVFSLNIKEFLANNRVRIPNFVSGTAQFTLVKGQGMIRSFTLKLRNCTVKAPDNVSLFFGSSVIRANIQGSFDRLWGGGNLRNKRKVLKPPKSRWSMVHF